LSRAWELTSKPFAIRMCVRLDKARRISSSDAIPAAVTAPQ
jgi:hypothetical protein